ncbi:MAG: hypothetical protein H6774_02695 [Pseudomonadales bacterium]|nr:hypothetical protein [Pseudomonadales bacterium]
MQYISTTDLRTQTSQLIAALDRGEEVTLIHRSKVRGKILPYKNKRNVVAFDAQKFEQFVADLSELPPESHTEREKNYKAHLRKKYGSDFS